MHKYLSFNNNYLNKIGFKIRLSGWIIKKILFGKIIFINLIYKINSSIQLIINSNLIGMNRFLNLNINSVILVDGVVKKKINCNDIEIFVHKLKIISNSILIKYSTIDEKIKLKYSYLEYRKFIKKKRFLLKSKFINWIRLFMIYNEFNEFNTPLFTSFSHEGSRNYLVYNRFYKNKFYSLPQSPQIYKQLIMISSFHRYFQIAPCFRDEDARKNRLIGEFYQLDIEMSFVDQMEILNFIEKLIFSLVSEFWRNKFDNRIIKLNYFDSIKYYATDSPDLRNPLILFLFCKNLQLYALPIKSDFFNKKFSNVFLIVNKLKYYYKNIYPWINGINVKNFTSNYIIDKLNLKRNDSCIFIISNKINILNEIKTKIAILLNLISDDEIKFCWILSMPALKREKNNYTFNHNPFTMIKDYNYNDKIKIISCQFDLICNGIEIASGGMRCDNILKLIKSFNLINVSEKLLSKYFPGLYESYKFGVPPHGGIAIGIERLYMILTKLSNIRDTVLFPLTQNGVEPLSGSPNFI